MQKFSISTNQVEIEKAVQEIEQNFAFRAVQTIKSLKLSQEEERVVLEVSRAGRITHARLLETLGRPAPESERVIGTMLAKTYLIALPTTEPPVYVLSFALQPPKPLSPELAHEINNQVNQQGGVTEAYVRHVWDGFGEAGLGIIQKVMDDQGRKYAGSLAEVRGGGPRVVGRRFVELMQVNGAPIELLEETGEQLSYRQHVCPYKLKLGEVKLCDAVNSFDRALLKELGCTLRFTARLVDGQSHCQAVIERLPAESPRDN